MKETVKTSRTAGYLDMIHEMVHLYNIAHQVQDCSRGGVYHNRKFKEEAERRGLVISRHEAYGWTITEPSMKLIEYTIDKGWEEISIRRGYGWTPPPSTGTKAGNGGDSTGNTAGAQKEQYTQAAMPMLRKQRPGNQGREDHVYGLHGANAGSLKLIA